MLVSNLNPQARRMAKRRAYRLQHVALVIVIAAQLTGCGKSENSDGGVPPKITAGEITPADERAWLDTSALVYTSDYFSFVGRDARGFVAFALDNNRGRDGKEYQAEHATALYDEKAGWIGIAGTGRFENVHRELVGIPDSPFFQFTGDVKTGITILSPRNGLDLEVGPMAQRVIRHDNRTFYALGTAPAKLHWDQRTITGRVIYEDFIRTNFNRMTRPSPSLFKGFNAFYLLTDNGGDLYMRSSNATSLSVPEPVLGFRVENGSSEILEDLHVEETSHSLAWGLYRWPTSWRASWLGPEGRTTLNLHLLSRKGMVNWVIGGYSLSIVTGEVSYGGKTMAVYGWGELIR